MFISVGLVVLIVPYSNVSPILRLPERLVVGKGGKPWQSLTAMFHLYYDYQRDLGWGREASHDSPLQQCFTYITTTRETCGGEGRQAMTVPYSNVSPILRLPERLVVGKGGKPWQSLTAMFHLYYDYQRDLWWGREASHDSPLQQCFTYITTNRETCGGGGRQAMTVPYTNVSPTLYIMTTRGTCGGGERQAMTVPYSNVSPILRLPERLGVGKGGKPWQSLTAMFHLYYDYQRDLWWGREASHDSPLQQCFTYITTNRETCGGGGRQAMTVPYTNVSPTLYIMTTRGTCGGGGRQAMTVPYSNVSPILRLPERLVVGKGGKPWQSLTAMFHLYYDYQRDLGWGREASHDSPLQQCFTYITTTRETCGGGGRQAMTVPYSNVSPILRLTERLVVGEGGKPWQSLTAMFHLYYDYQRDLGWGREASHDSPLQQCFTYITTTRETCGGGGRQAMTVPYSNVSPILRLPERLVVGEGGKPWQSLTAMFHLYYDYQRDLWWWREASHDSPLQQCFTYITTTRETCGGGKEASHDSPLQQIKFNLS